MNNTGTEAFDIGYLDTLASGGSILQLLYPRAKLVTTLAFIVAVISFDKYALAAITPFFIYPIALISLGGLPARYILKKVLLAAPFAVLVGMCNPFLDRGTVMHLGSVGISGGWISFASILLRFFLTVSAAFTLISLTGFNAVCAALLKFRVPRPFVVQLLFSHRYIFVLTDEAYSMLRARSLRAPASRLLALKTFIPLTGNLLLRSLGRAERIYRAMCCRGFDGQIRLVRPMRLAAGDVIFTCGWILVFAAFRYFNAPLYLGSILTGLLR